jgi:general secretion pathway protein H
MTLRSRRQAGFTLLEMIVTIAVMGLTLALLASAMKPRSHRLEMESAARDVAEAMRRARGQAIAEGVPVAPTMPHLPAWLAVVMQAPRGGIVFAPDGSSSGGAVLLAGAGERVAVTVDWLTGRVAIDAGHE